MIIMIILNFGQIDMILFSVTFIMSIFGMIGCRYLKLYLMTLWLSYFMLDIILVCLVIFNYITQINDIKSKLFAFIFTIFELILQIIWIYFYIKFFIKIASLKSFDRIILSKQLKQETFFLNFLFLKNN